MGDFSRIKGDTSISRRETLSCATDITATQLLGLLDMVNLHWDGGYITLTLMDERRHQNLYPAYHDIIEAIEKWRASGAPLNLRFKTYREDIGWITTVYRFR